MSNKFHSITLVALLFGCAAQAMVFDNRFFPLIQHPFITVDCRPSHFAMDVFFTTAERGFARNEEELGLPELFGIYDQRELGRAFNTAGIPNPLRSTFQNYELPWNMFGKIQSQGFDISWYQSFCDHLGFGFLTLVMRSDSWIDFSCKFASPTFTAEEKVELGQVMRAMHDTIGLRCGHAHQVGFGDIEMFLRWHECWDYCLKFRKIDAGVRFGLLVPTGVTRDIFEPASVAFGGNGHWGVYGTIDSEFELKEDWKLGLLARVSKRFARTCLHRMPVCKEPQTFGVVVGQATVNPGPTVVLSSYLSFEGLREGLGMRLQLTWTNHSKDSWSDARADKTVPVNLVPLVDLSEWRSTYLTLNAFYDFGKVKLCRDFDPIVVFAWDVPVTFFDTYGVVKTNKVSLGIEFNF